MSRNAKIALAVGGGLLLVCICAGAVGLLAINQFGRTISRSVVTDPTQAAAAGDNIASFEIPPGYEQSAMRLFGFDMVFISQPGQDSRSLIMLMQFPKNAGLTEEQMEQQMQQAMERQMNWGNLSLSKVGEEQVEIRGEPVTLTVREGSDSNGTQVRQMSGVFTGNGGPALIMIMGPIDSWDQDMVDNFIASIQ